MEFAVRPGDGSATLRSLRLRYYLSPDFDIYG